MARVGGTEQAYAARKSRIHAGRRHAATRVLLALALCLAWSTLAAAQPDAIENFDRSDQRLLRDNKAIKRKFAFYRSGARYLAAISYQVLRMPPERVFDLLQEVNKTLPYLPATHKATRVKSKDGVERVQMVHGNAWLQGGYTVLWEPSRERGVIRFWMDPEMPHDIADIWGYFRLQRFEAGKSLLTVAVAVAPGEGYKGPIWEQKIHKYMLKSARYLRKYVDKLVAKEQRKVTAR